MIIAQTKNFILENHPNPEVSRNDGGHLRINPKVPVEDRTELSPELVIEMALLTNLAGRAMKDGLREQCIDIGRINYQDNGNWNPKLHVHLYGRSPNATYQIYGEPLIAPRKPQDKVPQEPLTESDCQAIRNKILEYSKQAGYDNLGVY